MWTRAGESAESSNYFKSLPKRNTDSLNHWYLSITAASACLTNIRRLIHATSLSAGDMQSIPSIAGMEKCRSLQRSEEKVWCGAGNWKSCQCWGKCIKHYIIVSHEISSAEMVHRVAQQFLFLKWCFHSFLNINNFIECENWHVYRDLFTNFFLFFWVSVMNPELILKTTLSANTLICNPCLNYSAVFPHAFCVVNKHLFWDGLSSHV